MFAGLKGCYMNQGKRSDKRMTKAEQWRIPYFFTFQQNQWRMG
jgi:hypothetical protein